MNLKLGKSIIRTTVAALALGALVAHAATSSDITVSGTVASTLAVTSTATTHTATLGAGEKIEKVSDIGLTTNNTTGLTLTVAAGTLKNTTDTKSPSSVGFVVTTQDDGTVTLPASTSFPTGTYTFATTAASDNLQRDLYIKYSSDSLIDPGTYSGTISLTVADNA